MKVDTIQTKFGDIEVEYSSFTKGFFIKKMPEKFTKIQGLKLLTSRDNSFLEFSKLETYVRELVHNARFDFEFKRKVIIYRMGVDESNYSNSLSFEYIIADESEKTQKDQGKENQLSEYVVIESNIDSYLKKRNILGQILFTSYKEFVMIDYDEKTHFFLKRFNENFISLKKSLKDFFDKDKIKQNIIDSKLNNSNLLN